MPRGRAACPRADKTKGVPSEVPDKTAADIEGRLVSLESEGNPTKSRRRHPLFRKRLGRVDRPHRGPLFLSGPRTSAGSAPLVWRTVFLRQSTPDRASLATAAGISSSGRQRMTTRPAAAAAAISVTGRPRPTSRRPSFADWRLRSASARMRCPFAARARPSVVPRRPAPMMPMSAIMVQPAIARPSAGAAVRRGAGRDPLKE